MPCGARHRGIGRKLQAAVACAENNPSLSQAQAQSIFLSKYIRYASLKTNYGDSAFDVRQRFAASVIYDLPFGHDKLLLSNLRGPGDLLVSGWGLASIFDTQTGVPFIPTTGADGNRDGDTTDRVVIVGPVAHRAGKLTKNFSGTTRSSVTSLPAAPAAPLAAGDGVIDPLARMHRGYLRNPRHLQLGFPTEQNHQSDRAFPPALHLGLLQRPESFQLQ